MRQLFKISLVLISVLLVSCQKQEDMSVSAACGELHFTCSTVEMTCTKSVYPSSCENSLKTVAIALYDHEGLLARSGYFTDMSQISLKAIVGRRYTAYALFNVGKVEFPGLESGLKELMFSWNQGSVVTRGFPAAWSSQVEFASEGQTVTIEAERLVSKVNFKVDNSGLSDHNGKFIVKSLFLRNCPARFFPFDRDRTEGVKDYSTDAATINDINALNGGSQASFYSLENLRGTLLPGNTDPWKKVPAGIEADSIRCTYVEVEGTYSTDSAKLTAPVRYRLYIGSDATTNFDLNRNEIYNVTLCPSDEGIEKTSWKITVGEFEDERSIRFSPDTLVMRLGSSVVFTALPCPSDMAYTVIGWDGGTARLDVVSTAVPNEWTVSGSGKIENDTLVHLRATSWDGRVTAGLPVKLMVKTLKKIELSPDTVVLASGKTQAYTVTATYDANGTETKEDVTSKTVFSCLNPTDTVVVRMGTTESTKNVATAVNGGQATVTAAFGGMTATSKFITDYPVSLSANCEGYGDTGDWKWDFYKIGASATPTYTVTTKYHSGKTRLLSTSEYTVSDNTGSEYVDFSTNGIVKMVGFDVNTGCKASVKFSYTEAGKTVTLTKIWYKVYVMSIFFMNENVEFNGPWDYGSSYVYCTYNDGSSEKVGTFSSIKAGKLVSSNSYYLEVAKSGYTASALRKGSVTVTSTESYRQCFISQSVNTWAAGAISAASGTYVKPEERMLPGITYYPAYQDADGYHFVSDGQIEAYHSVSFFYSGSVTSDKLHEDVKGKEGCEYIITIWSRNTYTYVNAVSSTDLRVYPEDWP